ncbi:MAG: dihydrolipoamide acetyltransferase family protein [Fibrobacterota bacterium]
MAAPILMPQQGNTVEECLLVAWKKKKGETVQSGEVLAEIETDKATFELESPAAGTLLETFFKEGELVPVLTAIGVIGAPGEAVDSFRPVPGKKTASKKETPANIEKAVSKAGNAESRSAEAPAGGSGISLSPRALRYLKKHAVPLDRVQGSGASGRIIERDVKRAYEAASRVSPLAADFMAQGFRAPETGSGPAGLILAENLRKPGKQLSGIRATIASRMRASLLSTAQYTVSARADATTLVALRKELKARALEITINDLVIFATAATLKGFPELNAELIDNTLYLYDDIHLGFACDTPKGLLVPVIKKCQTLSLTEQAKETRRLAEKAQKGGLTPDEMTGGTFTVSNLGAYGVTSFTPVLNAPQVALLGVCAITPEPVRKDGQVTFIDTIGFSLTADHQAVDGAVAARFLQALSGNIAQIRSLTGPNI